MIEIKCTGTDFLPLEALEDFQGSLKKRGKKEISLITKSIKKYGFSFPFFVWQDGPHNYILDGHGRLTALKLMQSNGDALPLFPVVYIDAQDEAEAKNKLLRLNSGYGKMTKDSIFEFLDGVHVDFEELMLPGKDLLKFKISSEDTTGDDDAPEVQEEPISKPGEIYQLGVHRLMCGDSTKQEDVEKLMDGEKADMVFTDPPYGVSYTAKKNKNGKEWEMIKNDNLRGDKLNQFLFMAFSNMEHQTKDHASYYVFYSSSTHIEFEQALKKAGIKVKEQIIWSKGMLLGHSDYHWAHEPCLYCCKEKGKTRWFGSRDQKTVIGKKRKEYQELSKKQLINALLKISNNSTVWEISRDKVKEYAHPTQKPTHLSVRAIKNSTQKGDVVLDLFGGAGGTLISCEKTKRKCRMMEFDPKYCDVIRRRWKTWAIENDIDPGTDGLD